MGITETLTIFFIILKVMDKIDWSWFWVLFPEICSVAIYVIIFAASIIYNYKIYYKIDKSFRDWRW